MITDTPIAEQTDSERRTLTPARVAQGFGSQEQLDAFYAAHDHAQSCEGCQGVGGYVMLSDGPQPYARRCDEWRALDAAYRATR